MENILTNLISNIITGAGSTIDNLLNNLMEICFYAESTILNEEILGVSLTLDGLKSIILSFAVSIIILKFLKKRI